MFQISESNSYLDSFSEDMKKTPTLLTKQIRAERINKLVLAHGTGAPRKVKIATYSALVLKVILVHILILMRCVYLHNKMLSLVIYAEYEEHCRKNT